MSLNVFLLRITYVSVSLLQKAAEIMVRENKSLRLALSEMEGADMTGAEAAAMERRKSFQQMLWAERHKYYQELSNNPGLGKASLIGQALLAVNKLIEAGEWKDALEGVLKLAKIMGVVGAESQTNVVMNLSQKDIDAVREKLVAGSGVTAAKSVLN